MSKPPKPPVLGLVVFAGTVVIAASLSTLAGYYFFELAAKTESEFYSELGTLSLQLAVLVILGALLKLLLDWGFSQRARYSQLLEARKEFLRRVRAVHVEIQNARDLLNAHRSAKTWSKQSRRLMALQPDLEEICEDLKAAHELFPDQGGLVASLEAMVAYLTEAGAEYVRCHTDVDGGWKGNETLDDTINASKMTWAREFMNEGTAYKNKYEVHLKRVKGAMRKGVYGS